MSDYIRKLIAEGEHQMLDFKFEVSDYYKIARTLVAFSNTDGGRLLIGVKDNGAVVGVRSEEEYFMLEGAARLYCRPEIPFRIREWDVSGKKVLEAIIAAGAKRPYLARDYDQQWVAYIRQADQNFRACSIQLTVWKLQQEEQGSFLRFREAEKTVLTYLEKRQRITLSRFRHLAGVTQSQAEQTMLSLVMLGLVGIRYTETQVQFELTGNYNEILEGLD